MLPIIDAEETQSFMQSVQFGTGNMETSDAKLYSRQINKQANKRSIIKTKLMSSEMRNAITSSVGIGVIRTDKPLFPFNPDGK
jgi:hypothetical protein